MEKLYEVKITPRAEQSMQEIASYIAVDLMGPQTAVKLLRTLKKAIDSLDIFPARIHPTLVSNSLLILPANSDVSNLVLPATMRKKNLIGSGRVRQREMYKHEE